MCERWDQDGIVAGESRNGNEYSVMGTRGIIFVGTGTTGTPKSNGKGRETCGGNESSVWTPFPSPSRPERYLPTRAVYRAGPCMIGMRLCAFSSSVCTFLAHYTFQWQFTNPLLAKIDL